LLFSYLISAIAYSLVYYFAIWFILLTVSVTFILVNGIDYVSWPRLIPPMDIIYYNGPGYRSGHNGMGARKPEAGQLTAGKGTPVWLGGGHRRVQSRIDEIELGSKRVD
jgi:hypothetical protein